MLTDTARFHHVPTQIDTVDRAKWLLAIFAAVYAVGSCAMLALAQQSPYARGSFADWIALPVQLIAIASSAAVARGRWRTPGLTGLVWACVCAFSAMSLVATYGWNEWHALGRVPTLSFVDVLYFADYALLTAAYAVIFVRFGGSFGNPRTWLEAGTILVTLLGTFWAILLGPLLQPAHGTHVGLPFAAAYAVSLAVMMTMAGLLFLRIPGLWRRPIPALLIAAGLAEVVWEIGWLATWLTDQNFVGLYYNFGDVLCFSLIALAAAVTSRRLPTDPAAASAERSAHAFLPTLAALMAIALVAASLASSRATDAWILVGLVVLTAALLAMRQTAVRREVAGLNRALAVRAADERVTELVRQATEVVLVVDERGVITFASPASELVLGVAAAQLLGTSAAALLGRDEDFTLSRFLTRLITVPAPLAPLELPFERPDGALRILKVSGANRLDNPHIKGLTLSIADISEQRKTERDVLEAANEERIRLACDIHEGLGQELSGIALMLQSLTTAPNPDLVSQQHQLRSIIAHVANAIRATRDLARGLSPVAVVRGSLRDALERLAKDTGPRPAVSVTVDPAVDDGGVDDFCADHLFRIVQEALHNAIRHGRCSRVDIALRVIDGDLVLSVIDDGVGIARRSRANDGGLGLRFMEYRARVIHASFSVAPRAGGGTVVRVTTSLRNLAARVAAAD